jgi:hypothetical protein
MACVTKRFEYHNQEVPQLYPACPVGNREFAGV